MTGLVATSKEKKVQRIFILDTSSGKTIIIPIRTDEKNMEILSVALCEAMNGAGNQIFTFGYDPAQNETMVVAAKDIYEAVGFIINVNEKFEVLFDNTILSISYVGTKCEEAVFTVVLPMNRKLTYTLKQIS
jgi:hypothetical protein